MSAPPVRIAFCITDLDPGGAERALFHIVTRLDRQKWDPHVFSVTGGVVADWFQKEQIPVKSFDSTGLPKYKVINWLAFELRQFKPEIVHGFLFHGNIVSRIAGWRAGISIRLAGHRVAEREKKWHLWVDRITKRLVTKHICVSRGVADHICANLRINPSQIRVIPNGIESQSAPPQVTSVRSELGIPEEAKLVLAVGRLHRQKGFSDLISAFSGIVQQYQDAHLVIVGDGPERDALISQIRNFQLESHITLTGYRNDVAELMHAADLFVLSSHWEGMPNVVMQAMASGRPVVATAVEGIDELLTDEVSGLVVPRGKPSDLQKSILRLLNNPEFSRQLSRRAQDVVEKEFTWERAVEMYDELFASLVM